MAKRQVRDFDQSVCHGDHPEVDGPCPARAEADEDTGNAGIDKLARIETAAIEAATGRQQFKCGKCGCPLANLGATNRAPDDCPRFDLHDRVSQGV